MAVSALMTERVPVVDAGGWLKVHGYADLVPLLCATIAVWWCMVGVGAACVGRP